MHDGFVNDVIRYLDRAVLKRALTDHEMSLVAAAVAKTLALSVVQEDEDEDEDEDEGWRTIETAPKDRWILVWAPDSNVRDAAWCDVPASALRSGYTGWIEGLKEILSIEPTHWRPLPTPPQTKNPAQPEG